MKLTSRWRLLSFLVLLLYCLLVALSIVLLVSNLGMAILIGLTSLALAYSAWLLFVSTENGTVTGKWIFIVATLALTVEVVYFLSDQQNRRMLLTVVGITVVYVILFGVLRKKYWDSMRRQGAQDNQSTKFKNPCLIINPKSGNGRSVKANIPKLAEQQGITVIMTRKGVDIEVIALEAVKAGHDVIGISGGDGSIGAVAKVAIKHNLPIVVLPGGTRCHFARDLGLDPKQIADSLAGFTGTERRIDVGDINGRIFLNNASFGLYADIVDHADYRENKLKVTRQVLQDMVAGTKKPYDLRFKHKGTSIKAAVQVLVGVNQYNTINLLELGHRPRLDKGELQITVITKLNKRLANQLVKAFKFERHRKGADNPNLYQWTNDSIVIKSNKKKIVAGVDGEREVYTAPVKIRTLPGALRVYVPSEGVRNRRKSPFSSVVVKKIWQTASH